jgi:hypothetical protein
MAKTLSTMLSLGTPAPDFSLVDVVSGRTITVASFRGEKALLVMFICRHCPFVRHVQNELAPTGRDIRAALDALLDGKPIDPVQRPSAGCNIKWKPGTAPAYFGART